MVPIDGRGRGCRRNQGPGGIAGFRVSLFAQHPFYRGTCPAANAEVLLAAWLELMRTADLQARAAELRNLPAGEAADAAQATAQRFAVHCCCSVILQILQSCRCCRNVCGLPTPIVTGCVLRGFMR